MRSRPLATVTGISGSIVMVAHGHTALPLVVVVPLILVSLPEADSVMIVIAGIGAVAALLGGSALFLESGSVRNRLGIAALTVLGGCVALAVVSSDAVVLSAITAVPFVEIGRAHV